MKNTMENLELKLKSQSMTDRVVAEAMATQYRVIVDVKNQDLRSSFDDFWKENEKGIVAKLNIKGRKTKGGKMLSAQKMAESRVSPKILYRGVVPGIISKTLKDILFIESVEIHNFQDEAPEDYAQVLALMYFEPELHYEGEVSFKVNASAKLEYNPEDDWALRSMEIRKKHITYEELGDKAWEDEHQVLMDLIASVEGKPDNSMTYRNRWQTIQYLPTAVKEAVKNHKVGDLFECEFTVPVNSEETKKVMAVVKLHEARIGVLPELDDILAQKEGADSVSELKSDYIAKAEEYNSSQNKAIVADNVINGILMGSTFDPIPMVWLSENIEGTLRGYLDRFGGDSKKLCKAAGIETLDQFKDQLKGDLYRQLLQEVAVKFYARRYELDESDKEAILDHMLSKVEWVETSEEE